MNAISETFRILWLIFLWFGFSFMILVSLLSFIFGDWQWGALFLIMCPVFLAVIDMAHSESIVGKANGGPFHHFFIFVFFFGAVGLIVLTALTAFGVLRTADAMLWDPATNFASWYMVGGLLIVDFLIYRTDPNDDIPDLRRMEQLDRRSARVGVVSAAIFTVLCLVVPLTSFMTAGYDPVALAVALFLAPGFLRVVREGLFYLQGPRFEEGSEGYRILRVVCVGVAGLAGCIALGYLGYSLVRLELLPALFFAASVAMNGWSVKKYVTVGITIPEKEDDEAPKTTPVTG
ncbi:hypothetical protein O3663_07770 [Rothia mucilaginosa]|jgi:hypothetical protein|uniref:hypothetical protein n=1 Tax=Rothia mucilaginosa TaxID=43675 RepID=UPI00066DBF6A|nr:hypothetical protein [Rothia mucilaginosa]MDU2145571.1 hypothetical protein [Staphylococcus sp.]